MVVQPQQITTLEQSKAFIDQFDNFLFDCDGVLWSGDQQIGSSSDAIRLLKEHGKQIFFVTNNSTRSRQYYQGKLQRIGIETDLDHIFGSSYAAAIYLKEKRLETYQGKKVYVVGMDGICEELSNLGVPYLDDKEDDDFPMNSTSDLSTVEERSDIGAVVVGFDIHINYRKLAKAFTYVHYGGAEYYGTNDDSSFPCGGKIYPGTGIFLAALSKALKREPVILGKPYTILLDLIVEKFNLNRKRTCMVGDRLDTDILFGINGNISSALVFSGVTHKSDLKTSSIQPDFTFDSLDSLLPSSYKK